ncbi:MarR family winged helix-turn-helix transcriptional regulator [Chachezhania antarctica]|uniref:MarR family winged helix-turn-helix transcriptional regulator n=1 Tax=Chachezhania antarctica TaxID=2340860 RepID=UPI000EB29D41|nr:MarR family transcriptional regulator [Chachezhania antarctica]|tara:strand:+ start:8170 stop:8655 length:486 start_codon:yes stop_codon:yes gene_type:complete
MNSDDLSSLLDLLNEISVIEQLGGALVEARLPADMIGPQFRVLDYLIRVADGRTPVELARAFQVPKTTLTHTLSRLDNQELVRTLPNPNDRRSKCVWTTEKGRAARDKVADDLTQEMEDILQRFGKSRSAELMVLLEALRDAMAEAKSPEIPRQPPAYPDA